MKLEIEINDLTTFAKGLNNALAAYGDVVSSIILGCETQVKVTRFQPLTKVSKEELKDRFNTLLEIYHQVERLESEVK